MTTACRGVLQIDTARGKSAADEYGIRFLETSAKDGTNVKNAFQSIAKDIVERMVAGPPASSGSDPGGAGGAVSGTVVWQRLQ